MKIVMLEERGVFRLHWYFEPGDDGSADDQIGCMIGEVSDQDPDDAYVAKRIAELMKPSEDEREGLGFVFHTMARAKKALRIAKAAWRERSGSKPWPEWAVLATAAGWKPPKGWKP